MLIHRKAGGLYYKDICAANVLQYLDVNLAIGKTRDRGFGSLHAQADANLIRQGLIGGAAKDLKLVIVASPLRFLFALGRCLLISAVGRWCCRRHNPHPFEAGLLYPGLPVPSALSSFTLHLLVQKTGWAARIRT